MSDDDSDQSALFRDHGAYFFVAIGLFYIGNIFYVYKGCKRYNYPVIPWVIIAAVIFIFVWCCLSKPPDPEPEPQILRERFLPARDHIVLVPVLIRVS